MTFVLTHSGLDCDEEVTNHDTLAASIEAAVKWFLDGYDNPTIPKSDELAADLVTDENRIRECLTAGEEFYCGRFYERITVKEVGQC